MSILDPVTLAVIESGLQQVCNEMDLAFVRSAFSPAISEALDRSDGIYARETGQGLVFQEESDTEPSPPTGTTPTSTSTDDARRPKLRVVK